MTAIDRRIQDAKSQGRTAMARLWDGLKEIIAEATTKTAKREGARLVSHMIEETLRGGGYTMRPDDMREIERMTSNVNRDRAVSTSELGKSMHPVNFELVPSAELEEIERYIAGASLIGKGLTWGRRLLKGTRGLFASKAGPAAAKTGARAGVKGWMRPKPGRLSRAWNFGRAPGSPLWKKAAGGAGRLGAVMAPWLGADALLMRGQRRKLERVNQSLGRKIQDLGFQGEGYEYTRKESTMAKAALSEELVAYVAQTVSENHPEFLYEDIADILAQRYELDYEDAYAFAVMYGMPEFVKRLMAGAGRGAGRLARGGGRMAKRGVAAAGGVPLMAAAGPGGQAAPLRRIAAAGARKRGGRAGSAIVGAAGATGRFIKRHPVVSAGVGGFGAGRISAKVDRRAQRGHAKDIRKILNRA